MTKQCSVCHGNGKPMCRDSGALLDSPCEACDGSGMECRLYYANVLVHKNHELKPIMCPTLYNSAEDAKKYYHREFIVIKTIEVRL